jgi:membrane protein implicated in regulation of membrane protease activity
VAAVEACLHLVNPWLLLAAIVAAAPSGLPEALLLAAGAAALAVKPYRVWVAMQFYL